MGAEPRVRNRAGSTPFHLAVQDTGRGGSGAPLARQTQAEIVTAFLAAGVSADLPDARGRTVHDCARSDPVRALLAGAAPRQADGSASAGARSASRTPVTTSPTTMMAGLPKPDCCKSESSSRRLVKHWR